MIRRLGIPLLIVGLWVLIAFAAYQGWIHGVDHRDFYPRWAGARLALYEGRDLYSAETTRQMQLMLYGRERRAGEDPQAFAYPAILVPLLLPFWVIPNVEVATALWESTSLLLLIAAVIVVRSAAPDPKFPRGWIAPALFTPYVILMLFNGQITALPFAAVAFAYAGYERRRDWLGGAALVIGFIKPEIMLVPAVWFLLLALRDRRWRFLGGFLLAGVLLFIASLIVAGWWIPGWLDALQRYAAYAQVSWSPVAAWAVHPLLAVGVGALTLLTLTRFRLDSFGAAAGGTALGMLLLPQTLIWGLTMLSLPLAMTWRGRARTAAILAWLAFWAVEIAAVLLTASIADVWKLENAVLPLIALVAAAFAARQPAT